jgi:hypothetical protein
MTKTQAKEIAQKLLLESMGTASYRLEDIRNPNSALPITDEEKDVIYDAIDSQMKRIEKSFQRSVLTHSILT